MQQDSEKYLRLDHSLYQIFRILSSHLKRDLLGAFDNLKYNRGNYLEIKAHNESIQNMKKKLDQINRIISKAIKVLYLIFREKLKLYESPITP